MRHFESEITIYSNHCFRELHIRRNMSEKLDECYEFVVKLSKEGGQVGVPIFKYMNYLNKLSGI
jgi:hypothetical protein